MDIRHIVLSSAAQNGINMVGILYQAEYHKIIKYDKIKTVYGTSAGAIVLALWLTRIDKESLHEFIIGCPWGKTYKPSPNIINGLLNEKGFLSIEHLTNILSPVFKSQGIDINITLMDFYKYTNIEFHIFSTNSNTFKCIDMSHKTYPDLKLFEAIYMSISIPIVFKPLFFNDCYVIDGGVTMGYPLTPCIENGAKEENILGVNVFRPAIPHLGKDCDFIKYVTHLINIGSQQLLKTGQPTIANQLIINASQITDDIDIIINDREKRRKLIINGEESFDSFLKGRV
tara:strand:- start:5930 stop:6787 length:858 start_codon:yes stop_codon:yes gene_type:complete